MLVIGCENQLPMAKIGTPAGHDHPFGQKNLDYASPAPLHPGYTGFGPNDDHGPPAPAFTLNRLDGTTIQFPEHYRDKIVAIRFWADWCPFCKTEMADLEPVYRHYHDRGLVILAINVMQSPEDVRAFTERLGIS